MTAPVDFNEAIDIIVDALVQARYDPKAQLYGYIQTGDPTYITRTNNARQIIELLDKDQLRQYVLTHFL